MTIFRAVLAVFSVVAHAGALLYLFAAHGWGALVAGFAVSGVWTLHNKFLRA